MMMMSKEGFFDFIDNLPEEERNKEYDSLGEAVHALTELIKEAQNKSRESDNGIYKVI